MVCVVVTHFVWQNLFQSLPCQPTGFQLLAGLLGGLSPHKSLRLGQEVGHQDLQTHSIIWTTLTVMYFHYGGKLFAFKKNARFCAIATCLLQHSHFWEFSKSPSLTGKLYDITQMYLFCGCSLHRHEWWIPLLKTNLWEALSNERNVCSNNNNVYRVVEVHNVMADGSHFWHQFGAQPYLTKEICNKDYCYGLVCIATADRSTPVYYTFQCLDGSHFWHQFGARPADQRDMCSYKIFMLWF